MANITGFGFSIRLLHQLLVQVRKFYLSVFMVDPDIFNIFLAGNIVDYLVNVVS